MFFLAEGIEEQPIEEISCEECDKIFANNDKLKEHMRSEHLEKPCDICGRVFQNLKNHQRYVHGKFETKSTNIQCESCGKVYSTRKALKEHKNKAHDPSQQLPCDKGCDKVFHNKVTLKDHIRQVHSKKPCTICGKMFNEQMLKNHMNSIHTEDHLKPFICHICHKGFASKQHLNTHMNIHTGVKPHVCKYCGKGFADSGNMRMHERTTHEGYKRPNKGGGTGITGGKMTTYGVETSSEII